MTDQNSHNFILLHAETYANTIMYYALAFCVAWLVSVCSCLQHEVKSPGAQAFCGDHFIKTWELICQLKLSRRSRVPRAIGKFISLKNLDLFPHSACWQRSVTGGQNNFLKEGVYFHSTFGAKYSRIYQVKFVSESL